MAWLLTRSEAPPPRKELMGTLLVIMIITLGLALRTAAVSRHPRAAGSVNRDESEIVDTYARMSLLVLFCLLGLLALGLMYGNVLRGPEG